jgi:hypothetical protein
MTSFPQIEASRLNALKSTGPTTLNGKRSAKRPAAWAHRRDVIGLMFRLAALPRCRLALAPCNRPSSGKPFP